jgi:hypothetical protein
MVQEIKTVPYVSLSHPFAERLIGPIRREHLDQTLFWTEADLEEKLRTFQDYFNKRSLGLKRTAARSRGCWCAIKLRFVPMAEALSRIAA